MRKPILEERVLVEEGALEREEQLLQLVREAAALEDATPVDEGEVFEEERLGSGSDLFREIAEEAEEDWDDYVDETWDEDPSDSAYEEVRRERALAEYLRESNWTPDGFPIEPPEVFGL